MRTLNRAIRLLMIEDNPGDVRLVREAFRESKRNVDIEAIGDGETAVTRLLAVGRGLEHSAPDLIILDLNIPRRNGFEVLTIIKESHVLHSIPVIILTSSSAQDDIIRAYDLHSNCYVTKPGDFNEFFSTITHLEKFWFDTVRIPHTKEVE